MLVHACIAEVASSRVLLLGGTQRPTNELLWCVFDSGCRGQRLRPASTHKPPLAPMGVWLTATTCVPALPCPARMCHPVVRAAWAAGACPVPGPGKAHVAAHAGGRAWRAHVASHTASPGTAAAMANAKWAAVHGCCTRRAAGHEQVWCAAQPTSVRPPHCRSPVNLRAQPCVMGGAMLLLLLLAA